MCTKSIDHRVLILGNIDECAVGAWRMVTQSREHWSVCIMPDIISILVWIMNSIRSIGVYTKNTLTWMTTSVTIGFNQSHGRSPIFLTWKDLMIFVWILKYSIERRVHQKHVWRGCLTWKSWNRIVHLFPVQQMWRNVTHDLCSIIAVTDNATNSDSTKSINAKHPQFRWFIDASQVRGHTNSNTYPKSRQTKSKIIHLKLAQ
jgi:hypothetical protein